MRTLSNITHEYYTNEDCVFFRNILQSAKYMSWGATLIDLFTDSEDKLVFVFLKSDHEKYKLRWGSTKVKTIC